MARSTFDAETFWQRVEELGGRSAGLMKLDIDSRLLHCHVCDGLQTHGKCCQRCGAVVHHRIEGSIEGTWALLCAAVLMLIPANIYPVMTVKKLGKGQPDTIVSGIISLMDAGLWGLGFIVLFASIIVPFAKLFSLGYLLYSVQNYSTWKPRDRTLLYRFTEAIGEEVRRGDVAQSAEQGGDDPVERGRKQVEPLIPDTTKTQFIRGSGN